MVKATGVSRETIQFYLREGILPKPRKREKNQAEYDESYVELLRLIKDLQENHFLPLGVIKKIIRRRKNVPPDEDYHYRVLREFFSPVDEILAKEVVGEAAFLEATGLSEYWRERAEAWGMITPEIRAEQKVYSFEDVSIGKLLVEMDRAGFGPHEGFDPEALKYFGRLFDDFLQTYHTRFAEQYYGRLPMDEFVDMGHRILDMMGIFFYLRYRKTAKQLTEEYISRLLEEKKASS